MANLKMTQQDLLAFFGMDATQVAPLPDLADHRGRVVRVPLVSYVMALTSLADEEDIFDALMDLCGSEEDEDISDFVRNHVSLLDVLILMKVQDESMPILLHDALLQGGFKSPIGCHLEADGGLCQMNGHHRLLAALLAGLETIDVFVQEGARIDFQHTEDQEDSYWFAWMYKDDQEEDVLLRAEALLTEVQEAAEAKVRARLESLQASWLGEMEALVAA